MLMDWMTHHSKTVNSPNLIYGSKAILIKKKKKKNAPRFFVVIYKVILKLVLKIKDSRTPKTILTKKIRVRIIQPEIKAYYIGTLIKIVWYD